MPGGDGSLARVQHTEEAHAPSLPGIDTPIGPKQRLKIFVPSPDSVFTVGAIGDHDARHDPLGPGGFAFRTVENLAAEIHKNTIVDTDGNTTIHTGRDFTTVAGNSLNLSTNGTAQLGAVSSITITAGPLAGYVDPAFTVKPPMGVPPPTAIDTATDRESTELGKEVFGLAWLAFDWYSGMDALKSLKKEGVYPKGVQKGTFAGVAEATIKQYSTAQKLFDAGMETYDAIVAAIPTHDPPDPPDGEENQGKNEGHGDAHAAPHEPHPPHPKVIIYGMDGIKMYSPQKIAAHATMGVNVSSQFKVTLKAGVSATMKSMVSSTVFSIFSSKLESKFGVASVTGPIVFIKGKKDAEVTAKKNLVISSHDFLAVESDRKMRISSAKTLSMSSDYSWLLAETHVGVLSDDKIALKAMKKLAAHGEDDVEITSKERITSKVANTDIEITDGKIALGVGSFVANIDASSFVCGNTSIKKSEATLKGTIRLG